MPGLPKIAVKGTGSFKMPDPIPLTTRSNTGDYVSFENYIGILKMWTVDSVHITLNDGTPLIVNRSRLSP